MKWAYKIIATFFDLVLSPLVLLAAILLKLVRKHIVGFWENYSYLGVSRAIFNKVGIFPVINHYYEPQFQFNKTGKESEPKQLPGLDMNLAEQLVLLDTMEYRQELIDLSELPVSKLTYSFDKGPFRSGDAEYLYAFVRLKKPRTIIEVGCGHSSLIIQHAMKANKTENQAHVCEHICVEPYENDWLDGLEVTTIRALVESLPPAFFDKLRAGDILFIDSSHIIRPDGDVLYEILQLLPCLAPGVYVHFHDIFTPRDYLTEWTSNGMLFWNEQYILEAYLSDNKKYKIIGAINYLKQNHYAALNKVCPFLTPDREPGSFWIQRIE